MQSLGGHQFRLQRLQRVEWEPSSVTFMAPSPWLRYVYDRAMSARSFEITAFILAGGKSSRMGSDKAFAMLHGATLLSRMLDLVRSVVQDVTIVGDSAKFSSFGPVVEDLFHGCGPLAGIHAALRRSPTDLNLIIAVDTPFLSTEFLQFLIEESRATSATVTIARTSDGWQPLCAVYHRAFADAAEKALRSGHYRIDALFDPATTRVIEENELRRKGFSSHLFRNLNTPEELSDAQTSPSSESLNPKSRDA